VRLLFDKVKKVPLGAMAAEPRGEVCGRPSTENYAMTTPASAVRPDQTSEREYEREQGLIKRIKEQYAAVTDATKNIVARAIALGESLVEANGGYAGLDEITSDSTCIYGGLHRPSRPLLRGRIFSQRDACPNSLFGEACYFAV
jgi:hypothetical protein